MQITRRQMKWTAIIVVAAFLIGFVPNFWSTPSFTLTVPDGAPANAFRGLAPGTYQVRTISWYGVYFSVLTKNGVIAELSLEKSRY